MRIGLVSDWYAPRMGGLETYLDGLARHLQAEGHQVTVLTPVPGDPIVNGVAVKRLCGPGPDGGYRFAPSHHAANGPDFLYLIDLFAGGIRPRALERLRLALMDKSHDVVHVHLGNTPFSYLAVNLCRELGIPTVATFHSVLGAMEKPLAALAGRALGCRSWADDVVLSAVSSLTARNRSVMFGDAPFRVLHNALDSDWTAEVRNRRASRSPSQQIQLVSTMRLHPRKRPEAMIDALRRAVRSGSTSLPVHLNIAGDGPLRGRLQGKIDRAGLTGDVTLLGQASRSAVADLLADADLFLMPSHLESFGIAALEARMAGVPVLAMRDAGSSDFLAADVDSLLVDDDDGFAEAIGQFLARPELRARLGEGAARPLGGFTWPDLIAVCHSAYAAAISLRQR